MRATLRWKGSIWLTQGCKKRILVPMLTDLRLWSMCSIFTTHLQALPRALLSFLFTASTTFSFPFHCHPSHPPQTSPFPSSVHILGNLTISFLYICHIRSGTWRHTQPPLTVHLRRSDCVNLSQCHATFQFAICLTGSYWLAHTLVILPVPSPFCPISTSPFENSFHISLPYTSIHPCSHPFIITPPLTRIYLHLSTLLNSIPTSHFTFSFHFTLRTL